MLATRPLAAFFCAVCARLISLVAGQLGAQSAHTLPGCPGLLGVPPVPVSVLVTPSSKS